MEGRVTQVKVARIPYEEVTTTPDLPSDKWLLEDLELMLGILQWLKICRLKWHRCTLSSNMFIQKRMFRKPTFLVARG